MSLNENSPMSNSPSRQSNQDQANMAAIQLFTGADGQSLNPETLAFLKTLQQSLVQQSIVQQQVDAITANNASLTNQSGTVRQLLQQAEAGQMFQQIIQPSIPPLKIEPEPHRISQHPPPPKKPLTPYMTFSKMIWPSVKAQNANATVCQVGAIIGDLWRNFSDEQKQPYNELFNKDKLRYEIEMQAYTKATGLRASDIMKQRAEKRAAGINTRTPARSRDNTNQSQSIASVLHQQQEQNDRLMPDINHCFTTNANNANQQQMALQQYILNDQGNIMQVNNQQQALQQILPFYNLEQVQQQQNQPQNSQQNQQQQYLVYHLKADGTTEFLLQPQQNETQQQQQQAAIIKQEQQQQQQFNNLNMLLGNQDLFSILNQFKNSLIEKTKEAEVLSYQLAQAYEQIHHYRQQNDLLLLQQQQSLKSEAMDTPASQNNSRPPSNEGTTIATGSRVDDDK